MRVKLYPFIQFKDRADTFCGKWFIVEVFAATTVAVQAQTGHDGLLSLFEIHEIEFAEHHGVWHLCSGVLAGEVVGKIGLFRFVAYIVPLLQLVVSNRASAAVKNKAIFFINQFFIGLVK